MRAGNRTLSAMDQIRESILAGSVVTGERLNEIRLSRILAVSRTPARAALRALAGKGLLDCEPNRGFTERNTDQTNVPES
jgi:GntR family transcriptional regulator of vanillate catabolism